MHGQEVGASVDPGPIAEMDTLRISRCGKNRVNWTQLDGNKDDAHE